MRTQLVLSAGSQVKPLPFRLYFAAIIFLAGSGLAASIYLALSHYRVFTDNGYRSFCAISRAINCDTVSQSPYAFFLNVPVPVWGVAVYTFLLIFVFCFVGPKDSRGRGWAIAFTISLAFSGYSAVLAFISSYYIGAYCIVCIYTYAVNFFLAYMTWLVRKRFESMSYLRALIADISYLRQRLTLSASTAVIAAGSILALILFFPAYWSFALPESVLKLPTGITDDGHPWIGSDSAPIVITEYSDYLCFQCKKMNFYLRQLISQYPDRVKLIHRHFPMDSRFNPILKTPFHEGAGLMSLIAIHATENEKFWLVNDYLFSIAGHTNRIDIGELSAKVGLDGRKIKKSFNNPNTRQKLLRDIENGLRLGITGTPSYLIDGKVYHGKIPREILNKIQN
jgi:uncharacterized membrane protein/protein-disulfide isomerase